MRANRGVCAAPVAGWARFPNSSSLRVPSVGGEQGAVATGAFLK